MLFRKRGYYITVVSWENDGDSPKEESSFQSTKEEAAIAVAMCRMFTTRSDRTSPGIGNLGVGSMPKVLAAFKTFYTEYPLWLGDLTLEAFDSTDENELDDIGYSIMELISEYGLCGSSEYFLTRVASRITVQYFPQDVICEDVTDQF